MSAGRRALAAGAGLAILLALSGCAGMPTGGSVNAGYTVDDQGGPPEPLFLPDAPQPGATPQQIVEGFLRAGSGPVDNWEIARLYLAPSFREEWNPDAGVTIDVLADRVATATTDTTLEVQVTQVSQIDETGAYTVVERRPTTLSFSLSDESGQWRITEAPDGIVLDEDQFDSVYNSYPLTYFDPTWQYLVPELRWFPRTNAATRIALALVDGAPSPWLAESVTTAFVDDVSLQGPAVPVESGVAQVTLGASVLALDPTARNRMYTQLRASLLDAGVSEVEMIVSGTALEVQEVPTRSTRVNALALGLTEQGFGYISSTEIVRIEGVTETMATVQPAPVAIQLSADAQYAAVRVADGSVVRVQADGQVLATDTRAGLVDPSLDPQGFIWSVPADAPGAVLAVPVGGGEGVAVRDAWVGASRITAMSVSRDGTRIVAIVTVGGNSQVQVAGIVRDADGVPQRLGDSVVLATLPGVGTDVGWLSDVTVGSLASSGQEVALHQQPVGGPAAAALPTPTGIVTLAGSTAPNGVRLRDADGVLYARRGTNWQQTGTGVLVLATQSGLP